MMLLSESRPEMFFTVPPLVVRPSGTGTSPTVFTEIRIGGGSIVGVPTNIAQTNPNKLRFNPYWWQGGGIDSMLAALMVDLVARPEFREAEESRAIYEVSGVTYGDRDSHRKAGEVVARQEALTGQETVGGRNQTHPADSSD